MTTTCADIVSRANGFSILNPSLTSNVAEMLSRIRSDQRELCAAIADETRDFFQTVEISTSTIAVQNRAIDLSSFPLPVERILKTELLNGTELSQVDILDPEAELAPRYTVRGLSLVEWRNEWSTGNALAVAIKVTYVYAPTDIDPAGTLAQPITIPDEWADLLTLPLAAYCVHKDVGRDNGEYERLQAMLSARRDAFFKYLRHYGGVESRRFDLPSPIGTKK